jgi:hypothetical protein
MQINTIAKLLLIGGALLASTANALAQSTDSLTIPIYASGGGSAERVLVSDQVIGARLGPVIDTAVSLHDDGTFQIYIPFNIQQNNVSRIQSAGHVVLRVLIRGSRKYPATAISLYGLPDRKDILQAKTGDYSQGALLFHLGLPQAASGWLSFDVTKFAIQQVDGNNKALAFRLQIEDDPSAAPVDTVRGVEFGQAAFGGSGYPFLQVIHTTADASTIDNKVMAGYQGWFRTPNDVAGNTSWAHWFNSTPSQAQEAFDSWPDLSEFTAGELAPVPGFQYPDGSQATLYSGQNTRSVLRHFQWMENEGIDGVWLSQFESHLPCPNPPTPPATCSTGASDYPNVLQIMENVQAAAAATGRTWALEYDTSGADPSNLAANLEQQWKNMVDQGYTSDPHYLHQNGLPVVEIYGFFPVTSTPSNHILGDPTVGNPLITFFQTPGKYQAFVVGSGAWYWTQGSTDFQQMLLRLGAYIPWNVGHDTIDSSTGNIKAQTGTWISDNAAFAAHNVKFIPLVFPGTNAAGPPTANPTAPRRDGNFFWEQFVAASQIGGINAIYVAMFDELNEGTQIMPITNSPPSQTPAFYTYDGYPGDWYERLAVEGETLLKSNQPAPPTIPIQP